MRWSRRTGRVPGSGEQVVRTTDKPDHGDLLSATELQALVGVSNVHVVKRALERLGVAPVTQASGSISVYNNGGTGGHTWETPLYNPSVAAAVEDELRKHAKASGKPGKFRYDDLTFGWRAVDGAGAD